MKYGDGLKYQREINGLSLLDVEKAKANAHDHLLVHLYTYF